MPPPWLRLIPPPPALRGIPPLRISPPERPPIGWDGRLKLLGLCERGAERSRMMGGLMRTGSPPPWRS
jgi:hypothetical protein